MMMLRLRVVDSLAKSISFLRYRLPGGVFVWPILDVFLLLLVDIVRLFAGRWRASGIENCKRPEKPLILYEFEGCPYCRKVREALSVLDIDHYVYPCPRETLRARGVCLNSRFRPAVSKLGNRIAFPFLVDPNANVHMFESDAIVAYLWETYGAAAKAPLNYRLAHWPPFRDFTLKLGMFFRPSVEMGILRAPSHAPGTPLELWGCENSPFVRRVRETLTMLELAYLYHEVPFGSEEKRTALKAEFGHKFSFAGIRDSLGLVQMPFLKDPNTEVAIAESSQIVKYLCRQYQTAPPAAESWMEYGVADESKKEK